MDRRTFNILIKCETIQTAPDFDAIHPRRGVYVLGRIRAVVFTGLVTPMYDEVIEPCVF